MGSDVVVVVVVVNLGGGGGGGGREGGPLKGGRVFLGGGFVQKYIVAK